MELTKSKDLRICSIKRLYLELEENLPDRKTIAILCSTNEINENKLRLLDDYLLIEVADTLDDRLPMAFSLVDGMAVRDFLDKNLDFGRLYVCCDSGESRSTAISAAIMRYFEKTDMEVWKNPYYHPNTLVYREQCSAFGKKVSKLKLKFLRYLSDKAFRERVNKK